MKAIKLRTEQKVNPIGIDGKEQFLSWICEDGISRVHIRLKHVLEIRPFMIAVKWQVRTCIICWN